VSFVEKQNEEPWVPEEYWEDDYPTKPYVPSPPPAPHHRDYAYAIPAMTNFEWKHTSKPIELEAGKHFADQHCIYHASCIRWDGTQSFILSSLMDIRAIIRDIPEDNWRPSFGHPMSYRYIVEFPLIFEVVNVKRALDWKARV